MRDYILETIRMFLNEPFFSYLIGLPLLEYGLSRYNKRPFSKKNLWLFFLISHGIALIIRANYLVK